MALIYHNRLIAGGGSDLEIGLTGINGNLISNGNFRSPVNQRGLETYQGEGYTIDRWYIYAGRLDIVRGSHITITRNNMTDYFDLRQLFEELDKDLVYTFSILSDGELYSVTGTFVSNPVTKTPFGEILISWGGKLNIAAIRPLTTDPVNITATKLELGTRQTLAHKEGDTWVLNEIPNYAVELMKCQMYFRHIDGGWNCADFGIGKPESWNKFIDGGIILNPPMRVTPTVKVLYIWNKDTESELQFSTQPTLEATSASIGALVWDANDAIDIQRGSHYSVSMDLSSDL